MLIKNDLKVNNIIMSLINKSPEHRKCADEEQTGLFLNFQTSDDKWKSVDLLQIVLSNHKVKK